MYISNFMLMRVKHEKSCITWGPDRGKEFDTSLSFTFFESLKFGPYITYIGAQCHYVVITT